jgi:hypothetical protein
VEDRIAPAPAGPAETILVVEDNADARESLCLALELRGHRVLPAADGPAALEVMERERPRVAVHRTARRSPGEPRRQTACAARSRPLAEGGRAWAGPPAAVRW